MVSVVPQPVLHLLKLLLPCQLALHDVFGSALCDRTKWGIHKVSDKKTFQLPNIQTSLRLLHCNEFREGRKKVDVCRLEESRLSLSDSTYHFFLHPYRHYHVYETRPTEDI